MGIHLFTGFPGFLASQLIRQLFRDGVTKQIYAIVLHKGGITCPDFLETLPNIVKFYKENRQRSELFIPIK